MISTACKNFMRWQALAGMLIVLAWLVAPLLANTGLNTWYSVIREPLLSVSFGGAGMGKPMLDWINQAGMALVLYLAGLECKRAVMDGELVGPDRLGLPLAAAFGGLLASGLVCAAMASSGPSAGSFWVIPLGMDAALGLAVLTWLGDRVPGVLKAFFTTAAIFSAIAAVFLLAGMQIQTLSWPQAALALGCLAVLLAMNLGHVESVSLYALASLVLWAALAGSVAHAALAGLLSAFFIPTHNRSQSRFPLLELEQDLLPLVCCVVVPLMALANAGIRAGGMAGAPVPESQLLGVLLAMFPGKALGVLGMCWIGKRLRICMLPPGVDWKEFTGAALLSGVGFTVNVFLGIATLGRGSASQDMISLATMAGSGLSMLAGYLFLRQALAGRRNKVLQRS